MNVEVYCSHTNKLIYRKYFNRCYLCKAEWYSKDPVPLVVIGLSNSDDVIVNNISYTEIERRTVKKQEENRMAMFFRRIWNRIAWAAKGNQVSYSEAHIYQCQFCYKKFSKSFFKDICSVCVRKAIIKALDEKEK